MKYSVADADTDFPLSDYSKTLIKFAKSYKGYLERYDSEIIDKKVRFVLVTNRTISPNLLSAIHVLQGKLEKDTLSGHAINQFKQAETHLGKILDHKLIKPFACLLEFQGGDKNLEDGKLELARTVSNWSAIQDYDSIALGKLNQLVRDKCGTKGQQRNLLLQKDVLTSMGRTRVAELLPCVPHFPEGFDLVERKELESIRRILESNHSVVLVKADGGVGKTSFMRTISQINPQKAVTVLFDCFGGGSYRSPEDARHLPRKAFSHIANELAFMGLCDPLIPSDTAQLDMLVKAFRDRLKNAVLTANGRKIILLIDAADNAIYASKQNSDDCFVKALLQSISIDPMVGVHLIVSSRPHRAEGVMEEVSNYSTIELSPLSCDECATYLKKVYPHLPQKKYEGIHKRSGGNPRTIDYLLKSPVKLSGTGVLSLEIILLKIIEEAGSRGGYCKKKLSLFLQGLVILPTPIPLSDFARSLGVDESAIKSFIIDVNPLIENLDGEIFFRDEHAEDVVRANYASSKSAIEGFVQNLRAGSPTSYISRVLPELFVHLKDLDSLLDLLKEAEFPEGLSRIGIDRIRDARLRATVKLVCSEDKDNYDALYSALLEASMVELKRNIGLQIVIKNPELVGAHGDFDALTQIQDSSSSKKLEKLAKLLLANIFMGKSNAASKYLDELEGWLDFNIRKEDPDHFTPYDIAALVLGYVCFDRRKDAIRTLKGWQGEYVWASEYNILIGEQFALLLKLYPFGEQKSIIAKLWPQKIDLGFCIFTRLVDYFDEAQIGLYVISFLTDKNCESLREGFGAKDSLLRMKVIELAEKLFFNGEYEASKRVLSVLSNPKVNFFDYKSSYFEDRMEGLFRWVSLSAALNGKEILPADLMPEYKFKTNVDIDISGVSLVEFKGYLDEKSIEVKALKNVDESDKGHDLECIGEMVELGRDTLPSLIEHLSFYLKALTALMEQDSKSTDLFRAFYRLPKEKMLGTRYHKFKRGFYENVSIRLGLSFVRNAKNLRADLLDTLYLDILSEKPKSLGWFVEEQIEVLEHLISSNEIEKAFCLAQHIVSSLKEADERPDLIRDALVGVSKALLAAHKKESHIFYKMVYEYAGVFGRDDYAILDEFITLLSTSKSEFKPETLRKIEFSYEISHLDEEGSKAPWVEYGEAISSISGMQGLHRLVCWHIAGKAPLEYSLMPYLYAMVQLKKIDSMKALLLLRICMPVDTYSCGFEAFAEALLKSSNQKASLLGEALRQYHENNNGYYSYDELDKLIDLIESYAPTLENEAEYLREIKVELMRSENKIQSTEKVIVRNIDDKVIGKSKIEIEQEEFVSSLVYDYSQLSSNDLAIEVAKINHKKTYGREIEDLYLRKLRESVSFNARNQYLLDLAGVPDLFYHAKVDEIFECIKLWADSSLSLANDLKRLPEILIRQHPEEFLDAYRLKGNIKKLSRYCAVSEAKLASIAVRIILESRISLDAAAWIAYAKLISERLKPNYFAERAEDFVSKELPEISESKNATYAISSLSQNGLWANIFWMMLGSPVAKDRWLAVHSLKRICKAGDWEVLYELIGYLSKSNTVELGTPTFPMHAKLWLLILIAKLAPLYPQQLSQGSCQLYSILQDAEFEHVQIKHFALNALQSLLNCHNVAEEIDFAVLSSVNVSPHKLVNTTLPFADRWQERPKESSDERSLPSLGYDFVKYKVASLADVFGKKCWEVEKDVQEVILSFNPNLKSIFDNPYANDIQIPYRDSDSIDSYGDYISHHALMLCAGKYLKSTPIHKRSYDSGNPWEEWLSRNLLTSKAGKWISDDVVRPPICSKIKLIKHQEGPVEIDSTRGTVLRLINWGQPKLNLHGRWTTLDNVNVSIRSALIENDIAEREALSLVKENPFTVWLPVANELSGANDYNKDGYMPLVYDDGFGEALLDSGDPLGDILSLERPLMLPKYIQQVPNVCEGSIDTQVWVHGVRPEHRHDERSAGFVVECLKDVLSKILSNNSKTYIAFIKLQQYDEYRDRDERYQHTTAVVTINSKLELKYYKGLDNEVYKG